ncbi:MAG: ROK family transcriptional regulator [Lachnospiraceae bacterium]|nr:ROK family transcriptional regulator [Lachnospiraceae bacterium]
MLRIKKTKYNILSYMLDHGNTSKVELAKLLNISMPTILSNVNELIEDGVVIEKGERESTGGRKAVEIGLACDYRYALGMDITPNHLGMVLVNICGDILKQERIRMKFNTSITYYTKLSEKLKEFYAAEIPSDKILGLGISMPGIINQREKMLVKSHALHLENYSLKMMEQIMAMPVYYENDANAAMLAENPQKLRNSIYLSLNNTLGGAVCIDGRLFTGQNRKAGEFGHMILVPGGRKCYCGKSGCADAYCAASVLTHDGQEKLEDFMRKIHTDARTGETWEEYLEHLAILISNLRMSYDTDIILGGDVGGYLPDYMFELGQKIFQYNLFDSDLSYLKNCSYRKEASAVGVAKQFFWRFIENI